MSEELVGVLSMIAARLEEGAEGLPLDQFPAPLREAVSRSSAAPPELDDAVAQRLRRDLRAPEGPDSGTAAPEVGDFPAEGSGTTTGRQADLGTFAGVLLAVVAMAAGTERAGRLLDSLPGHLKAQLLQALVSDATLRDRRERLGAPAVGIAVELCSQLGGRETWGPDWAVEVIRELGDGGRMGRALAALGDLDGNALAQIQNRLFGFEDLVQLQDAELQVLMMQVDNKTLGLALQQVSEETKKRFYTNMSVRRRRIVAEEEELHGEAIPAEIEEAQGVFMDAVRKLYRARKISTYFGAAQEDSRPRPREEDRERALSAGVGGGVAEPDAEVAADASEAAPSRPSRKKAKIPIPAVIGGLAAVGVMALAWLWLGGESSSLSTDRSGGGQPSERETTGGGAKKGEISVGSSFRPEKQEAGQTASAQVMQTPVRRTRLTADGKAVLDLPGQAQAEVEPLGERIQTYREESTEEEAPKGLFLAVGRVRTTILDPEFYVRTPMIRVTGTAGAVFETRVVIDRTTYLEVESGEVTAVSQVGGGETKLAAGQSARFDP